MIEAVFLGTFTWAKLNLADMSRTGLNAEIRDTKEGTVYPAPIEGRRFGRAEAHPYRSQR